MRKLLVASILLVPIPALAEDLTVSVGSVTETWTLSAADQTKFEEWVQAAYKLPTCLVTPPTQGQPPAQKAPQAPPPGQRPAPLAACTLAESEAMWARAILQGTINNVDQHHRNIAAQDAIKDVPPITPVKKSGP